MFRNQDVKVIKKLPRSGIRESFKWTLGRTQVLPTLSLGAWRIGHRTHLRRPGFESRQGIRILGKNTEIMSFIHKLCSMHCLFAYLRNRCIGDKFKKSNANFSKDPSKVGMCKLDCI
jgi:hypothetical protein